MNIVPVAWMVEKDNDVSFIMCGKGFAKPDGAWNKVTPVYTHPANLTDPQIYEVFESCLFEGGFSKYEFARAILRKAQVK